MKKTDYNEAEAQAESMQSVLDYLSKICSLKVATIKDYKAQVIRCREIYNSNRLVDIPADLSAFLSRWGRKDYLANHFVTAKAYRAWRKKMVSVLKAYHGILNEEQARSQRQDEWTDLINIVKSDDQSHRLAHISIGILATESRQGGRRPRDLDSQWLDSLCEVLNPRRREGIVKAIRVLCKARVYSPEIDAFLPRDLPDPAKIRRRDPTILPEPLSTQLSALITDYCQGDYDEILEEHAEAKSRSTEYVYTAAAKKYLHSALRTGALPLDCANLPDAFEKAVFIEVMRDWIAETDPARVVTDRTKRSYIGNLMVLAVHLGKPVEFMDRAMRSNHNLKRGREEAKTMPPKTRTFCALLLGNRSKELLFKSLHLRFQERAKNLMASDDRSILGEFRIVQFGMLAVFAAIALWGVPLRIENLRMLRHRGADPSLVLPLGSRDRAQIFIPAGDVKNRKMIRAHISDGPARAVEVIDWYLREIRPRLPHANRSDFLFPGYEAETISAASLRDWLFAHTRELGLTMNPHNFRHGLASLYLRDHPGEYSQAARLLGNTPATVRIHYAWIDHDAEMVKVQAQVARMGGFFHHE